MTARISPTAAGAMMISGLTARLFYGLMIDSPEVHNGAWLSVLLGAALALPAVRTMARCIASGTYGTRRSLAAMLFPLLVLDAARAVDTAAFSAGYVAFSHVAAGLLALPLLAVALWAVRRGGEAIGNAVLLLYRPIAAMLILLAALQGGAYRPGWLAPVLGFGLPGIIGAGLMAAGWITIITGAMLLLTRDSAAARSALPAGRSVAAACAISVALILLRLMMAPSMDANGMNRLNQLDALLTNGRAPLYLQLPMIIIWFISLMNLICVECWAALALLREATGIPAWPGCGVTLAAIAGIALLQGDAWPPLRLLRDGQYWLIVAALLASIALRPFGKGGVSTCAPRD